MITDTLVQAFADSYSLEELTAMRAAAVADLAQNPSLIVSASTGGGASYSRQVKMPAAEYIELLQLAINLKTNPDATSGATFATPVFVYPVN